MWWKLGIAGALILPVAVVVVTYLVAQVAAKNDPSIGGAYVASLFFTVPISLPLGFVIGALLAHFL